MQIPAAIAGIGTDILYLHRIERVYDRFGMRFAHKILGHQELLKFEQRLSRDKQRGMRFLATRFAVKEAFSKAIGLGIRSPMRWTLVQTLNLPSGKPYIQLAGDLKTWVEARFGPSHVSITDESDLVMAFVILESKSNG